ncbi:imidazolonepropionase [Pseudomarimonas salicorniae]|uniref:Imidazolonepropionase n=1 Tax=Pseudomarimonas salicorniae TaxID=2933270 RepID=A0ABT0GMN8_9GAMM|nr:imidazolonepropionase [Lysobacter sp. CAU 1642]MCK7595637.1 imidazolonepropionase [Lysobacter sp. CAU 1642]
MPATDRLALHGARVATLEGSEGYGLVENASVVWRGERIEYVGPRGAAPPAEREWEAGGALLTPGLIDCHTHLVFAGNRAGEFEQRLKGVSYAEIARAGGGIAASVRATREADEDALLAASLPRALALRDDGVTTVEIKSGYGLDLDSELRMLRAARRIGEASGQSVRTSFLGAHALPPEFAGRADDYIARICEDWLPQIAESGLADAVDAYCEGIGFSPDQVDRLFSAARRHGLPVKLHADQLSDLGGAALLAHHGGLSADHVEYTSAEGVAAMATAGSVAVLLPGAFYALRETTLPPIAAFREHGVAMAVATDLNPGTSPLASLRTAMNMACVLFRLTPEEALRGATVHAARALGLSDRGRIAPGQRADLVLWQAEQPAELAYWTAGAAPLRVIAGGRQISCVAP